MPAESTITALVTRAGAGDQGAWNELVERYAPMVWSICRRFGLDRRDIDDVGQNVWLRAVEHLSSLRRPEKLGGWLATITKHECLRVLRSRRKNEGSERLVDADMIPDERSRMVDQELEAAERNAILRAAFAQLSPACQRMLTLLIDDVSYQEISTRLGMRIGSIGPTRARCLAKLRGHPALAALMRAEADASGDEQHV